MSTILGGGNMQDTGSGIRQEVNQDSITLGQLRAMVGSAPKPKQSWYDFNYDDEDTVMNELDELYSYVESPQVGENLRAWQGSFSGEWTRASAQQRKAHVDLLLEGLEHRDAVIRFTNARRLFYIIQGTFAETVSPEHQLHWIFENCKLVRQANGASAILEAFKLANSKHDLLCSLSDTDVTQLGISLEDQSNVIDEVVTEISVYIGMLYHIVEIFKGHDDFADELMTFDPPLPIYLFTVVAGLRDKAAKGYPIKKLLLLLWKTLLSCFGGIRDYARVKKLARDLAGLSSPPDVPEGETTIKSSPVDIETFRQETSVKYPTFVTPMSTPVTSPPPVYAPSPSSKFLSSTATTRLAEAYSPIPVRHHYHHDESDGQGMQHSGMPFHHQQSGSGFRNPQPPTPAPSPPPPPKTKKQAFQTDQNRPFLFPFSRAQAKNGKYVPFAIDEADKLYNKHMYVSLSLLQMWRTREDCMSFESGLDHMPSAEDNLEPALAVEQDDAESTELLPDVALLDAKIAEATIALDEAQSMSEKRKLKERKEDLLRLKRVETIYSAGLPVLSGWLLVLLKLILATVSASPNFQQGASTASNLFPSVGSPQDNSAPPQSIEDIDVTRHREITSKAASGILLLVLKWFKVSHAMKFHHLGQILLDTNCLLLLLKMFGLQEVSATLTTRNDSPDNNFFRYCYLHHSKNPQPTRPEDNMIKRDRHNIIKKRKLPNGDIIEEEVEMVTDYSWRNFFATINFAKIMQKLSKHRSHRIWMLVQYKSSAVLKRILKVQHPLLQLHLLKLIKSQVPFCGRKWRQTNMKVITSIYLNCRPDLRDEWLTGTESDDATEASAQETALRHLVKFYNTRRYGAAHANISQQALQHRRTGSMSQSLDGLHPGPELSMIRPTNTPNLQDADVFPPARSSAPNPSIFLPYTTEDINFEAEYEEYISDLGWDFANEGSEGSTSMWSRFPTEFQHMADNISDSESVVSIGDLGDDLGTSDGETVLDENRNDWEHLSPKTMAALPQSPATARRASSGAGLRPVVPFGLDTETPVDEEEEDPGQPPRETSAFASGAGVDEVEYKYGI
ncbi:N1221-domain-containing protein [Cylindrobasidium torrendii FP15055 ss-10]|uniref:N1221-domain-containing protein n=1 Tax=Cylindrobasidium torrendii FP15055 ss-10 TaxID=1314674 RepID=A0A0D7BVZ9_9AGAR|nr:N1221-domain-containing protein [Cylindrobasidium torrendii FP15055 ss-10]